MNRFLGMFLCLLIAIGVYAQDSKPPENWFTLDPESDKVQGVSADRVYREMKEREGRTVIVAVIDSGVDIEHEDLQGKIWKNEDEIAGNGIDDDKNGYADDVYGWNFIGGKDGRNVGPDTYELTREYVRLKEKYEGVEKPKRRDREEFEYWKEIQSKFLEEYEKADGQYKFYKQLQENTIRYYSLLRAYLDVDTLTLEMIKQVQSQDSVIQSAQQTVGMIMMNMGEDIPYEQLVGFLDEAVSYFEDRALYGYNPDFNPRDIVGDNWDEPYEIGYGNPDVEGPDASHGTHVAGIIAADRNNDIGIKGIAENVLIMPVRAVPDGDERDKDIANAIRYAVDNGADIINMSFGKGYSHRKQLVDEAIQYAESKGVLCVHAAGNSSDNLDEVTNFPTPVLEDGRRAENWLEVGASGWGENENFVGSFSNYGQTTVDLFAPGVQIFSLYPDNKYEFASGTSMAAPSTSGVAAVLMSYFPDLTAKQVKTILVESTRKFGDLQVARPGSGDLVPFADLSMTGGMVNAMKAIKMAEQLESGSIEK